MHECARRDQRSTLGTCNSPLYFLTQGLSLNLELTVLGRLAGRGPGHLLVSVSQRHVQPCVAFTGV